jgi:surfactin synthase thioesterase subunit
MSKTMKLILLPFAGGSSYSYHMLTRHLPCYLEVIAIDIPGHGRRLNEPLLYDCNSIANDIVRGLKEIIVSGMSYALFGHSMGALLGYIILQKAQAGQLPLPVHFFASGHKAPACPRTGESIWRLPSKAFWERLKDFNYTPDEILNHSAIMDFFEPMLRADCQAVDDCQYASCGPVPVPVTVLAGRDDDLDQAAIELWQQETIFPLRTHWFEGGHFFVFQNPGAVCSIITDTLSEYEL